MGEETEPGTGTDCLGCFVVVIKAQNKQSETTRGENHGNASAPQELLFLMACTQGGHKVLRTASWTFPRFSGSSLKYKPALEQICSDSPPFRASWAQPSLRSAAGRQLEGQSSDQGLSPGCLEHTLSRRYAILTWLL